MQKTSKLDIKNTIVKFLNREANVAELEQLDTWLQTQDNIDVFNQFVEVQFLTMVHMEKYDVKKAQAQIKLRIQKGKKRKKVIFLQKLTAAASVLLLVSLSIYTFADFETKDTGFENETISVGSHKALLTLENGDEILLDDDKKYETESLKGSAEELLYTQETAITETIKFNYLKVPRGGEYSLVLSDGTKVRLNSNSKIKYPTRFVSGQPRDVELLYGEAYFEVSPSTKHNGSVFNVMTKGQKIQVIGTQFNVKAYNEDSGIATTLVEGKVSVQKAGQKKILKPNQQSIINYDSDAIQISEVDVSKEISWINGLFAFKEEPLESMMKTLSRWYAAEIVFENAKQKEFVFTGVLERTQSIESILKIIQETNKREINFEIIENKIIIK